MITQKQALDAFGVKHAALPNGDATSRSYTVWLLNDDANEYRQAGAMK